MFNRLKRFSAPHQILLLITALAGLACVAAAMPTLLQAYDFQVTDQIIGATLFLIAAGICLLTFFFKTLNRRPDSLNFFIAGQLSLLLFLVSSEVEPLGFVVPAQVGIATLAVVYIQRTRRRSQGQVSTQQVDLLG